MYASYFSFRQEPFSIAPDPSFLYPSSQHRDALNQLLYGINKGGGMLLLTGEVGTGKTTLCRFLVNQLPAEVAVVSLHNSNVNNEDALSTICLLLGCQTEDETPSQPYEAIRDNLEKRDQEGKKTLLVVEEAQNLALPVLETLRLLTNIETDTHKLLHVLLIGQPELVVTLNRPDMRQLNQRIVARYHLQPLSFEETQNYITHRLTIADGQKDVFSQAAVKSLYAESGGIPRLINLIADRTLLSVYQDHGKQASSAQVEAAADVIKGSQPKQHQPIRLGRNAWVYVVGALLLVALLLFGWFLSPWLIERQLVAMQAKPNQPSSPPVATNQASVGQKIPVQPIPVQPQQLSPQVPLVTLKPIQQPAPVALPGNTLQIPQSEQRQKNLSVAKPVPVRKGKVDIESHLLNLWGLYTQKEEPLCAVAVRDGLACANLAGLPMEALLRYNRPTLVQLSTEDGQSEAALLFAIKGDRYHLVSESGDLKLTSLEFSLRWAGDALLLWRPPAGYKNPLRLGDRAREITLWLQDSLNQLGLVEGKIFSGGIYTQLLAERVEQIQQESNLVVDGILGRQTIMAISARLGRVPTLR
mgnify:CR=1 FL=1